LPTHFIYTDGIAWFRSIGGSMKHRSALFVLLVATALLLQACGGANTADLVNTAVAQTAQISQLQTAAAGGGQALASNTPEPGAPSSTPLPESTATQSFTATSSIPFVSVSENTNCRTGPSSNYGLVTTIQTNQQVEVLKVSSFSDYVVVRNPSGSGDCWLWLRYANNTNFSSYNLPSATQPPTPTPTFTPTPAFDWSGNWTVQAVNGGSTYSGPMSCNVSGNNLNCNVTLNPGALPYTFTGSISGNRQTAGGTFSGTGSGDWDGQIKSGNMNQFIGNLDASGTIWDFCGWRSGSSVPSPCKWP
jgi:hypothetical protein